MEECVPDTNRSDGERVDEGMTLPRAVRTRTGPLPVVLVLLVLAVSTVPVTARPGDRRRSRNA
jgi:hypothetical protein